MCQDQECPYRFGNGESKELSPINEVESLLRRTSPTPLSIRTVICAELAVGMPALMVAVTPDVLGL